MTSRTQSFILLLFGGVLLRLGLSDALLRYVRPSARIWIVLAAVAVVALSIWSLWRGAPSEPSDPDRISHDHDHSAGSRVAWLALAPILAILVVAAPALGSYSAARLPAAVAKPADTQFPALPGSDPAPDKLIDFAARAIWDDGRTLVGRRVVLTGFVLRGGSGGYVISRLVITCCAADARPVNVGIQTALPTPPVNSWVTVTGVYAGVSPSDKELPVLAASSVVATAARPIPMSDDHRDQLTERTRPGTRCSRFTTARNRAGTLRASGLEIPDTGHDSARRFFIFG